MEDVFKVQAHRPRPEHSPPDGFRGRDGFNTASAVAIKAETYRPLP